MFAKHKTRAGGAPASEELGLMMPRCREISAVSVVPGPRCLERNAVNHVLTGLLLLSPVRDRSPFDALFLY